MVAAAVDQTRTLAPVAYWVLGVWVGWQLGWMLSTVSVVGRRNLASVTQTKQLIEDACALFTAGLGERGRQKKRTTAAASQLGPGQLLVCAAGSDFHFPSSCGSWRRFALKPTVLPERPSLAVRNCR